MSLQLIVATLGEMPRTTSAVAALAGVDVEQARADLEQLSRVGIARWTRAQLTEREERELYDELNALQLEGQRQRVAELDALGHSKREIERLTGVEIRRVRELLKAEPHTPRPMPELDCWRISQAAARRRRTLGPHPTHPQTPKAVPTTPQTKENDTDMAAIDPEHDQTQNDATPGSDVCVRYVGRPSALPSEQLQMDLGAVA